MVIVEMVKQIGLFELLRVDAAAEHTLLLAFEHIAVLRYE